MSSLTCLSCLCVCLPPYSAAGVSASFGEMLLLVAMYFHSNQLSSIIELVCSTLGMKVRWEGGSDQYISLADQPLAPSSAAAVVHIKTTSLMKPLQHARIQLAALYPAASFQCYYLLSALLFLVCVLSSFPVSLYFPLRCVM